MKHKRDFTSTANSQWIRITRSAVFALIGGVIVMIAAWIICNLFLPFFWVLERI
ncbi:hypothetical protein L0156_02330 [bacterium]|nr:hypothetical protein [bacterium]